MEEINGIIIGGNFVTNSTTRFNEDFMWSSPYLIKTEEVGETIELTYKQTSMIINYLGSRNNKPDERVFKKIYSCKDGKWNKSERIYGKIVPTTEESYLFE